MSNLMSILFEIKVLAKSIDGRYVPSIEQLVDALTKPLSESQFSAMRSKLGVLLSPSRLREDVRTQVHDVVLEELPKG